MLLKITLLLIVISIAMVNVWNAYYRTLSDAKKVFNFIWQKLQKW